MQNREHYEQTKIFNWARNNELQYPELALLYAVPNGGKRTPRQGAWLKAEGLKAGFPDMCLPVGRGGYHALYIEQKVGKGTLQPNQRWWLKKLGENGNYAVASWDAAETVGIIKWYLNLPTKVDFEKNPVQTQESLTMHAEHIECV